jgi:D-alanyl-D-alanine dipeptidase
MNVRITFFILCLSVTMHPVFAQNRYGLKVTSYAEYLEEAKRNADKVLVDLQKYVPGLVLDIRYATTNNFTHERIYNLAKAYARKPVAIALGEIQAELKKKGLGIKIFDAYRPYKATVKFYELYHDTTYVASPYRGSKHNRGCALDLTLIDLKTGKELEMPTGYDSFRKEAWPSTPVQDPLIRKNRQLLMDVMQEHGFNVTASEWWHYDFRGWKNFEVMDIDFEQLQ